MTTDKQRLPIERDGTTHHFTIIAKTQDGAGVREVDGYIQTGCFADGRLGEVFLKVGKSGDETAWVDQWAIAISVALQYGVPLENLFHKFVGARFEPSGATKNTDIPRCTSLLDYVARWLMRKYGDAK